MNIFRFCEPFSLLSYFRKFIRIRKKSLKIKFNLKADEPNSNGDVYSKDTLSKAMKEYNKKVVKPKLALGIAGQPITKSMNLKDVAFQIESIEEVDDSWVADIKLIETQSGQVLKKLIKNPDNFRVVTCCEATVSISIKHLNGEEVITKHVGDDMKIVAVGIEPKENCA